MAWELHRTGFPGIAATPISERQVVKLVDGERRVAPCGSAGDRPLGIALRDAATDENVTVHADDNVVKAIAGASLGNGAEVMQGSTNGALVLAAGASGITRFAIGEVVSPAGAVAGEVLSVLVNRRQISNLI